MKELILLIGASGSGKSTVRKKLIESNPLLQVHSWDEIRLEFAGLHVENFANLPIIEQARIAFEYTTENSGKFSTFAQLRFVTQLKQGSVLVDNTNVSVKRRKFFIDQVGAKEFKIIAYVFPISKAELLRRAELRTDHKVPIASILQQWRSIQLPSIGEVDEIRFVMT